MIGLVAATQRRSYTNIPVNKTCAATCQWPDVGRQVSLKEGAVTHAPAQQA